MAQLIKRQAELAIELSDCVLKAAHIFAEAHKEELEDDVVAVTLKGLTAAAANVIANATDTEEDAQHIAEVFANDLTRLIKILNSKAQPNQ